MRWANRLLNVALVVAAVTAGGAFLFRKLTSEPGHRPHEAPLYAEGEVVSVSGVDPSTAPHTLLLVMQSTCDYCKEVMPVLAELLGPSPRPGLQVVGLSTDPVDVAKKYFGEHRIQADQMLQISTKQLRLHGTPAILLLDRQGRLVTMWEGQMHSVDRQELTRAISQLAIRG